MRVLMLTETSHLGGAEVMIRNLALELRARGHAVGLVAPLNGGDWLHTQMQQDGFPVWQFQLRGAINLELARCIRQAIAEFKPDVMHSHLWVMAAYGGMVAAFDRVPHVITMHGDGEQTRFLRRRVALRLAFARARAVVAVSDAMREQLATSLGISPSVMQVIANGSPFPQGDRLGTRSALGIQDDEFAVLCVGSQIVRKNHIVVLKALNRQPEGVRWKLVIAGPQGEATATLADEAKRTGVEQRLINLGPRSDVPDLQAAADLFVMPSLWEGMPVALVEAMGAGTPLIASAVGGIPAMVEDGVSGLLLRDATDDVELSTLISQCRAQRDRMQAMGETARRKAHEEYGVSGMTDAYLDLFHGRQYPHARNTASGIR